MSETDRVWGQFTLKDAFQKSHFQLYTQRLNLHATFKSWQTVNIALNAGILKNGHSHDFGFNRHYSIIWHWKHVYFGMASLHVNRIKSHSIWQTCQLVRISRISYGKWCKIREYVFFSQKYGFTIAKIVIHFFIFFLNFKF